MGTLRAALFRITMCFVPIAIMITEWMRTELNLVIASLTSTVIHSANSQILGDDVNGVLPRNSNDVGYKGLVDR